MKRDRRDTGYSISFVTDGTPEGVKNTMVIRIDLNEYSNMHKYDAVIFLKTLITDTMNALLEYEEVV